MPCPLFLPLALIFFLSLLLWCSLSLGVGNRDVQFMTEHLAVTHLHHTDWLWISTITVAHCKKKLHLSMLIATAIYGYKHSYLDGSMVDTSYLLSKIMALSSLPGRILTTFTVPDEDGPLWSGPQIQSELWYPCSMCVVIVPVEHLAEVVSSAVHRVHSWMRVQRTVLPPCPNSAFWQWEAILQGGSH